MDVFILFTGDSHHTHASKEIVGVFSSKEFAMQHLKDKEKKLKHEDFEDLERIDQTQGLDTNFMIETWELDYPIKYV